MIVCILWQHRLAIRHVHPQRGLFFAPEADSVLAITQKKEGWQLQLSDTLQFLDSPRRCRLISCRFPFIRLFSFIPSIPDVRCTCPRAPQSSSDP